MILVNTYHNRFTSCSRRCSLNNAKTSEVHLDERDPFPITGYIDYLHTIEQIYVDPYNFTHKNLQCP